jgi:hypothetical protein
MYRAGNSVEQVFGGTVIKQGDQTPLGFNFRDENGQLVSLLGATVQVKMASNKGVVVEKQATISDGYTVTFSLGQDDITGSGNMMIEFIVTYSGGTQEKFPSDDWQRIRITPTLEDVEKYGVGYITFEKLTGEFQNQFDEFKGDVDEQIDSQKQRVDNLISSTPQPSEVVDARLDENGNIFPTLKAHLDDKGNKLEVISNDSTILKDNVKGHTNPKEIGITRNEAQQTYVYPTRIPNPELPEAPFVTNIPYKGIDYIAHWYNDFGLEATAAKADKSNGSWIWYDWSWNFRGSANYDSSRDPLLGWYAGDDRKTLDYQCFWLASKGYNVISLVDAIDTSKWSDPTHKSYWQYVLFNQVKNFKSLRYITWLKHTRSQAEINAGADGVTVCNAQHNDAINNIIAKYSNFDILKQNGKTYPVVFTWDIEAMRGIYDNYNGNTNLKNHFKDLAASLQGLGYDGICIMGRNFTVVNGGVWTTQVLDELKASGVILLMSTYESCYGTHDSYGNSYDTYADTVNFPTEEYRILNVVTSAETKAPHPSNWTLRGSTPEAYTKALQKATDTVIANDMIRKITIYNVAEWAEGGPSLQPNKRDGFGYLDAVGRVNVNPINHINLKSYDNRLAAIETKTPSSNINTLFFPPSGVNDTYATHTGVVAPTGLSYIELLRIKLIWGGTFASGETVTIKVLANHADGTTTFIEKSATSASNIWLTDDDFVSLIKSGTRILNLYLYTKSNLASSTVTKSVRVIAIAR